VARDGALMMSVADFAIEIGDQAAGSRHLQILPLFHLGGFGQCLQALLTAGTVYIHTAFQPAAVIDAIGRDRIEFLTADIVRRVPAADGVLQQHVLRGTLPNGQPVALHAAMYLRVRDGHITRIEEYLDSGQRSAIRAAREALSG